jgi:histidyl-tRNA synthetase
MPQQHTLSHVVVCLVDGERASASIQCATQLRDAGYRVETNHKPKIGLGKQIATAAEKGVPYAVVVEADERITLYEVGQDKKHAIETLDELIEHLRACKL